MMDESEGGGVPPALLNDDRVGGKSLKPTRTLRTAHILLHQRKRRRQSNYAQRRGFIRDTSIALLLYNILNTSIIIYVLASTIHSSSSTRIHSLSSLI